MTRKSAYRLRDRPGAGSFAAAWERAQGWGQDRTVDVGLERSLCGERVPIVRNGRVVGEIHRHDNRLAMAVLNALDRRAVVRPVTPVVEEALFRMVEAVEKLGPH
jgi:hypothetical protein